jgi:type IX secretion system substrate protein
LKHISADFAVATLLLQLLSQPSGQCQSNPFNYSPYLFGNLHTLSVTVESVDTVTGFVRVNGGDSQGPRTPFTWKWGDGVVTSGFFPQVHTYSARSYDYVITVVASYSSGGHDSAQCLVRFIPPAITPIQLPGLTNVSIPSSEVSLASRMPGYGFSGELTFFADSFFTTIPRQSVEYILSTAASIEMDLVNDNVFLPDGNFNQVVLRDPSAGGAYSLWYSTPVALGAGDVMLSGAPDYSSLFHEMGHNFTLNFPANFFYGGRIDGNSNAIYSESMAQIFQHSCGYEIVNGYNTFGLSNDLAFEITQSLISSIGVVRKGYDDYLQHGRMFASWNDPSTPADETYGTFMTIAYEFCAQAESLGVGYREPLKRMTTLLGQFNSTMANAYGPQENTASADSFRATLMVAAVSYAFEKDLRPLFRSLNFPIDDAWYATLVKGVTNAGTIETPLEFALRQNYPNPFNPSTAISYDLAKRLDVSLIVYDLLGRQARVLVNRRQSPGHFQVRFDGAGLPSGVYFYTLNAGSYYTSRKMVLTK